MAKHSPGPFYRFAKQSKCIADANGQHIATALRYCGREQQDANANLIAASAEMLGELKLQAIAVRQEMQGTDPRYCLRLASLQLRLDRIEGVIAKAEGRTDG